MSVRVRPASLQDGVAVLELLEQVGYYPEPIPFAKTYRKTLTDPHFLVRKMALYLLGQLPPNPRIAYFLCRLSDLCATQSSCAKPAACEQCSHLDTSLSLHCFR